MCALVYICTCTDKEILAPLFRMAFVLHHDTFKHRQADTLLNMAKGKMLAVEE